MQYALAVLAGLGGAFIIVWLASFLFPPDEDDRQSIDNQPARDVLEALKRRNKP